MIPEVNLKIGSAMMGFPEITEHKIIPKFLGVMSLKLGIDLTKKNLLLNPWLLPSKRPAAVFL